MTKSLLSLFACICSATVVLGSHNFQCPTTGRRLELNNSAEIGTKQQPPKLDGEQYRRRAKARRRHGYLGGSTKSSKKFFQTTKSSKSSKSKSSTCKSSDDDERLECGNTYGSDARITLLGDLDCTGQITTEGGAAITLKDGAVLDCDGHTIQGGGEDETFNVTGVLLMGDAQVVNCEIAEFNIGIHVVGDANFVRDATIYGNVGGGIKVESDGCNAISNTDAPSNNGPGFDISGTGIVLLSDVSSIGNFNSDEFVEGLRIDTSGVTSTARRHLLDKLEIDPDASLTVVLDDATFSWNAGNGITTSGDSKLDLHLFGEIALIGNIGEGMELFATELSMTNLHEQTVISRNILNGINLAANAEVLFGEYSETSICNHDGTDQDGNDISDDIAGAGSFKLEDDGVVVCSTSTAASVDGFSCDPDACGDRADEGVEVCIK